MTTQTSQTLVRYLNSLNPAIDTNDPIIQDLVVKFGTQIITDVQNRVAYLNSRYTNAFLNQLTDNELDIYAYNSQGLVRGSGTPVTGYIYFMFTNLTDSLNISANTIVSTSDGVWKYSTLEPIFIDRANLSAFFNPVRNAYEVRVPVKALKPGTAYRVAAFRVNTIQSTLSVNARVENREPFTSGTDPESKESFINRINHSKVGFNLNSHFGLKESIVNNIPGIKDIQIVHLEGNRNSYNLYYIGYQPVSEVMEYQVTNPSNRTIPFDSRKTPIRYVDAVVVDGVTLPSTLYKYSQTKLVLHSSVTLTSSSVIFISFQYNKLNSLLKDHVEINIDFPGAEWVVKEAIPEFIKVKVNVKPQNYLTLTEVSSLVSDTLFQYLNPDQFILGVQASKIKNLLLDTHSYLLDCDVTINDLPFFDLKEGHYPILTSDNLTISLL